MTSLVVTEYGTRQGISNSAAMLGLPATTLRSVLAEAAGRAAAIVGANDAIQFHGDTFRFVGVAGIIRLGVSSQLEIVPKFLQPESVGWREDFFAVANLVKYGRILPREAAHGIVTESRNLSDLVGRAAVYLFDRHSRNPMREYRRRSWTSFDVDGDLDPETVVLPASEGFDQEGSVFDRRNPTNRVITDALRVLSHQVADGELRQQLVQRQQRLGDQSQERLPTRRRLPSRQRQWQDLYDLSWDVLRGYGTQYATQLQTPRPGSLPGYLLRTEDAWESLILSALRIGFGQTNVQKRGYTLGTRSRAGRRMNVVVTPDVSVGAASPLVVDAKYKSPDDNAEPRISPADLYEALAFAHASKAKRILLLYPSAPRDSGQLRPGSGVISETVVAVGCEVVAATVEVAGISAPGGLAEMCRVLAGRVADILGTAIPVEELSAAAGAEVA